MNYSSIIIKSFSGHFNLRSSSIRIEDVSYYIRYFYNDMHRIAIHISYSTGLSYTNLLEFDYYFNGNIRVVSCNRLDSNRLLTILNNVVVYVPKKPNDIFTSYLYIELKVVLNELYG